MSDDNPLTAWAPTTLSVSSLASWNSSLTVDEGFEEHDRLTHRAEDVRPGPDRESRLADVRGLVLRGEVGEVLGAPQVLGR
jgi:hypothetical protein